MTEPIFHLAETDHWASAQPTGEYRRSTLGRSLEDEGFIHLSTAEQWPGVLGRFYRDHEGELVLLTVDPDLLEDELRWEPPVPGSDELFPHLYGPLPVSAVTRPASSARRSGRRRPEPAPVDLSAGGPAGADVRRGPAPHPRGWSRPP